MSLTAAQIAQLDQAHAKAEEELDAMITQFREASAVHGHLNTAASLAWWMANEAHVATTAAVAAHAIARLAKEAT